MGVGEHRPDDALGGGCLPHGHPALRQAGDPAGDREVGAGGVEGAACRPANAMKKILDFSNNHT